MIFLKSHSTLVTEMGPELLFAYSKSGALSPLLKPKEEVRVKG